MYTDRRTEAELAITLEQVDEVRRRTRAASISFTFVGDILALVFGLAFTGTGVLLRRRERG